MFNLSVVIISTTIVLFIVRKYRERNWGKCSNNVKLSRKVVIVTGANTGIGYEIAKELAKREAHVIVACRSIEKAKDAIASVELELSQKVDMVPMLVNLASFRSVEYFCDKIASTYPSVDILINNAGVSFPKNERHETEDGLEIHFGVNYLSQFYLTTLLLEKLHSSSRVVIIASSLYEKGVIDLNNLNNLNPRIKTNLYANSKLASVYFCREFAKRTRQKGINIYAVCPGWVYTSLFRHSIKWYHYILVAPIAFFFMRSPKQGSQTPIYCATEPALKTETGFIYRDCKHYTSKMKFNEEISVSLWEKSETIINEIITKHQNC